MRSSMKINLNRLSKELSRDAVNISHGEDVSCSFEFNEQYIFKLNNKIKMV